MSLQTVSAAQTAELLAKGALLVDVREPDEFAREHIAGAINAPLSTLATLPEGQGRPTIFHCRSGARTQANAERLARAVNGPAYVLDGGLDAWRRDGRRTEIDRRQPLELARQTQLAAGALVVTGVALGFLVSPAFFGIAGFVGAGLMTAGATGWCGMARLLRVMPWNRVKQA